MTGRPVSQNPKLLLLMQKLSRMHGCRVCHSIDADTIFAFHVFLRRTYKTLAPPGLVARKLLENGYLCVDSEFLEEGLVHAKFDHEFDVWVDTREADDFILDLSADFTGEIVLEEDELERTDIESLAQRFERAFSGAVKAFEAALHEPAWSALSEGLSGDSGGVRVFSAPSTKGRWLGLPFRRSSPASRNTTQPPL